MGNHTQKIDSFTIVKSPRGLLDDTHARRGSEKNPDKGGPVATARRRTARNDDTGRAGDAPARPVSHVDVAQVAVAALLAAGVRNTWCGWKMQMFVSPWTLASVISTK